MDDGSSMEKSQIAQKVQSNNQLISVNIVDESGAVYFNDTGSPELTPRQRTNDRTVSTIL